MIAKEFAKYLKRDGNQCPHCGRDDDTLVPNHRQNRGMGGSRSLDRPSNIVVLCHTANFLLESNAEFAAKGKAYGWKLTRDQVPEFTPVLLADGWWLIDNDYRKTPVPQNHPKYN